MVVVDFYFTDRKFNLIEIASTDGQAPYQLSVAADLESINAGARTLSGTLVFTKEQANRINQMATLGNYVLYHDKFGNDRFMTIMDIRHDPLNGTHDFTAEDAGVDLINETIGAYTADKAYDIAYYINKFTYDSGFKIGTNEISTLSRKLKWEGTDETALARVLSVATQFDAELDFSFEISGTNVVKRYINIYKHRGADNQIRLYLDKDINNIVTTGDIYDLYTSVYATGGTPEGSDKPITLKSYKWTDTDGRYELGADGILRDTVAVQLWSRLLSNDNPNPIKSHIQRSKIYEATTQASLLQSALGGLKKAANPAINYEVDIAVLPDNVTVGDTVHIVDDNEDLYLSARVLELKYDYALEQYTATLGDYLIEHDQVSSDLRELADQVKNMPKVVQYYPWVRYADDADGNGFSMFPQDKAYMAVIYGKTSTPSDNPSDYAGKWQRVVGPNGQDGADGIVGPAGEDGKTSYFHRAYANSLDGKTDFSVTDGNGKSYMGTYSDFIKADSTDPKRYTWTRILGEKGQDGAQGTPGKAGADGRTPYFHIAYANSSDSERNMNNWVLSDPAKQAATITYKNGVNTIDYKGVTAYEVFNFPVKAKKGQSFTFSFSWTQPDVKSLDGTASGVPVSIADTPITNAQIGRNVIYLGVSKTNNKLFTISGTATADTTYVSINLGFLRDGIQWQFKASFQQDFSQDPGEHEYMGWYSDFTALDSNDPSFYGWSLIKGADGANGAPGKAGADGKTPYFHTAWADSQDGKTNFSTTVSLGKKYLGTYTDFTVADSTDPTRYKWVELAGAVEQHVNDAINNLIPPPSSGISYPSNPKKGQQHWLTDANGKPKGLFQYNGSKWVAVPVNADTISANTLNGMTINGVTINGSTINSPNINVPFNNVPTNPDEPEGSPFATFVSGTTKLTSNLNISGNITDGTNKTPQWVKTLVSPQGFSSIISTPDASKALSVVEISLGAMFLSEWHSDVTANDGFVSSYLKAGDATTYERKDVIKDTANFKDAVIRYSRKGTQVNVGFSFTLLSETGWVGLSTIPRGYTPASLASVGITCPSLSYQGYFCIVYPNGLGWRLIPSKGQGKGGFQGTVSYVTYDDYPYNDAVH